MPAAPSSAGRGRPLSFLAYLFILQKTRVQEISEQRARELSDRYNDVLAVHYSCASFESVKTGIPEVSTIAVKNLYTGQTVSFSRSDFTDEVALLRAFFKFAEGNKEKLWVHWNMNNGMFGFDAIESRYRQLTGDEPFLLRREQMIDMDELLETKYGQNYASHNKLETLSRMNRYTMLDFIPGKEEGEHHAKGDFFVVKKSTLRKVEMMANVVRDFISRKLITRDNLLRRMLRAIEENAFYRFLVIAAVITTLVSFVWLFATR